MRFVFVFETVFQRTHPAAARGGDTLSAVLPPVAP